MGGDSWYPAIIGSKAVPLNLCQFMDGMVSDCSFTDMDEGGRTSTLLEGYMKNKFPSPSVSSTEQSIINRNVA